VNSTQLKREKRRLRAEVLARRDALEPADRARLGALVVARFLAMPEVRSARVVMAFWSFGSEVPMQPVIEALIAAGATLALPRITDGALEAVTWRPGEPVTETSFGAREPAAGTVVPPPSLDVVAVPGVAFDRAGGRVGYGGGYYDRFLPHVRGDALRAAVAFGVQVVDRPVPAGAFDLRVDAIVTPDETIRIGRS
jgi:5-formyltetrahydrofolate cyclo-ligase